MSTQTVISFLLCVMLFLSHPCRGFLQQPSRTASVRSLLAFATPPPFSGSTALNGLHSSKPLMSARSTFRSSISALSAATQSSDQQKKAKLGVLLLNLGGPEKLEDVEGFLYNLFSDPDIIRLPPIVNLLQKPIAYFISKTRGKKSAEGYKSIGGGSPIVKYTTEQAQLLQQRLNERLTAAAHNHPNQDSSTPNVLPTEASVYFAMRYWKPYTEEVLDEMKRDGVNSVVVLPLYPQYSISTSGSSLKLLSQRFKESPEYWDNPKQVAHTVIPAWHKRPGYLQTMAQLILRQIKHFSPYQCEESNGGIHVLFSAHGVPENYVSQYGDPYKKQIEDCVALIAEEVKNHLRSSGDCPAKERPTWLDSSMGWALAGTYKDLKRNGTSDETFRSKTSNMVLSHDTTSTDVHDNSHHTICDKKIKPIEFHLSFQSRVGPIQWLKPYTEDKLRELGERDGVKNLIVVPISFVSEHIETLEEIDMEYRELAHSFGITNWRRAPALNTENGFINDMADMVMDALDSPVLTVHDAVKMKYDDIENFDAVCKSYLADAKGKKECAESSHCPASSK